MCPPNLDAEAAQFRFTHTRPAGDEVQLDHVITPIQGWNIITDVSTVPGAALNSNQYLVKVSMTLRSKKERREKPKPKKTRRPTEGEKALYNRSVSSKLSHQLTNLLLNTRQDKQAANSSSSSRSQPGSQTDTASTHSSTTKPSPPCLNTHWQTIRDAVTQSFEDTITEETKARKQPWISNTTWDLIQQRIHARETGDKATEQELHKEVGSQARRGKTQWLKDRLAESEETVDARMKWKWIKRIRSEYKQRPVSLKDREGKPVSPPAVPNRPKPSRSTSRTSNGLPHSTCTQAATSPSSTQQTRISHPSPLRKWTPRSPNLPTTKRRGLTISPQRRGSGWTTTRGPTS